MFEHILVGFDGSEGGQHAATIALDLASKYGSTLYLLSVIEDLPRYAEESIDDVDEIVEQATKHYQSHQVAVEQRAKELGVTLHCYIQPGHVVESIVQFAEENKADLIVLGGLGHSTLLRRLSGSTGAQVAHYAPCDVLIAR